MITQFPQGLTVKQLKEMIKDWPEVDLFGDPCEVWLGSGNGLTNICTRVSSLNHRSDHDGVHVVESADLLLEINNVKK
jgi:hypothetical protein